MSQKIQQFNIQFDPIEDRLQLRILTETDTEIGVWLTRRYVRLLLQALDQHVAKGLMKVEPEKATDASNELAADASAEQAEDSQGADARPTAHTIIGDSPLLVSRIACRSQKSGNLGLVLGEEQDEGQHMELSLNDELVDGLCQMLTQSAKAAEWDLDLPITNLTSSVTMQPNTVLH